MYLTIVLISGIDHYVLAKILDIIRTSRTVIGHPDYVFIVPDAYTARVVGGAIHSLEFLGSPRILVFNSRKPEESSLRIIVQHPPDLVIDADRLGKLDYIKKLLSGMNVRIIRI